MAKEGLQFEFSADTTQYRKAVESMPRDLKKASDEIEQIAEEINTSMSVAVGRGLVQGLAGAGVALKLRNVIAEFDQVSDAAKRFGTTAEDIQRVDFAAKAAGSSMELVASAMDLAGVRANRAAREGGALADAFNRAGIDAVAFSMADLSGKIEMVARAQNSATGDVQQLTNITEALGQSVGGVDFASMAGGMRDVNVLSNETVRQLADANAEIVKFERNITVGVGSGLGFFARQMERIGSTLAAIDQDPLSFKPNPVIGKTVAELEQMDEALQPLPPLFDRAEEATDTAAESVVNYLEVLKQLTKVNDEMEASMARMEKGAGALSAQLAEAELRLSQLSNEFANSGDASVFKEIEKTAKEILSLRQQTAREEEKIRSETTKTSEEYRKQADAQAKATTSLMDEIQMLEAKLSGNTELTEELQRQKDFREAFAETRNVEQADRLAELRSRERQAGGSVGSAPRRGGGFSEPVPQTNIERLRAAAQTDPSARAALMRLNAEQSRGTERAGELRDGGMFSSAARAELRAERRAEQRAERFNAIQAATDRFGGRNMGEAFNNFRRMMSEQGVFGSNQQDFEKWAREQAKSEKQREQEERGAGAGGKGDAATKPADPMAGVATDISAIRNILTQQDGIHDRLPIRVMAAA
jgi:hypothetical protein